MSDDDLKRVSVSVADISNQERSLLLPGIINLLFIFVFAEMGGHVAQRPWTPTKRRGPIAAEFTGPGPAWVTLPSLIGTASSTSTDDLPNCHC